MAQGGSTPPPRLGDPRIPPWSTLREAVHDTREAFRDNQQHLQSTLPEQYMTEGANAPARDLKGVEPTLREAVHGYLPGHPGNGHNPTLREAVHG